MTATVPAGGSVTVRHAYTVAPTQAEAAATAAAIADEWRPPAARPAAPDRARARSLSPSPSRRRPTSSRRRSRASR